MIKGGWKSIPKRNRNVEVCCVCSNPFKIYQKKHMCRMCGCFMHDSNQCSYKYSTFTDEDGIDDNIICYRCFDDMGKLGIYDTDINNNSVDNIIRNCFNGESDLDNNSKYIYKNQLYNDKLKEIIKRRPTGNPKNKREVTGRVKYYNNVYYPVFEQMIYDSPLIKNKSELLDLCKLCSNDNVTVALKAGGMENEGIFINSDGDIIYKVLSVLENNPQKDDIFKLVANEWYYSTVGFNLNIAPEPIFLHICRTVFPITGGTRKKTKNKAKGKKKHRTISTIGKRKKTKMKSKNKGKKKNKISGGSNIIKYLFILGFKKYSLLSECGDPDSLDWSDILPTLQENGLKHGDGHDQNMVYNPENNKILLIDWAHTVEEKYEGIDEIMEFPGTDDY